MIKKTFKIIPMMLAGGICISALFSGPMIAYAETGTAESVEVPPERADGTPDGTAPDGQRDAESVEAPPGGAAGTSDGSSRKSAEADAVPVGAAPDSQSTGEPSPPSATGNICMDLNSDGKTDGEDIGELQNLIDGYDMSDHNRQEVAGELSRIIYGPLRSSGETPAELPSSYYLTNEGQVTAPKDQGYFGTCWAFSSVSALESSILKERQKLKREGADPVSHEGPVLEGLNKDVDLSEKYLAWLPYDSAGAGDGIKKEGMTTDRTGENVFYSGGLLLYGDTIWTSWRGVVKEEEEPYKADNFSDDYMSDNKNNTGSDGETLRWSVSGKNYETGDAGASARVNTVLTLPGTAVVEYKDGKNIWTGYDAGAASMIKQALMETGAVAIVYGADMSLYSQSGNRDFFNRANWSQYRDDDIFDVNHSVAIVGWDDSYPAENFQADKNGLPPGNGAWLVKNSWGSHEYYKDRYGGSYESVADITPEKNRDDIAWGINGDNGVGTGFFWLSYYDKTVTTAMAFGVDIPDDGWDHDNIYQYDYYTDMANYPLILRMYDNDTSVANVFSAKDNETLKAVSVRTVENNAKVNVKVYLLDGAEVTDPTAGVLVSEETAEIPVAGFTTLSLSKPVEFEKGQRFAVVETVTATGRDNEEMSFLNLETVVDFEKQTDSNMGYTRSTVFSNVGESFAKILIGGGYTWMDSVSLTNEIGEGIFAFGNALIKVFTVDTEDRPCEPGDHGRQDEDDGKDSKDSKDSKEDPGSKDEEDVRGDNKAASAMESDTKNTGTGIYPDQGVSVPASIAVKKETVVTASPVSVAQVKATETGDSDPGFVWMIAATVAAGVPAAFMIVRRKKDM